MSLYVSHADLGGQRGHGRVVPEPEGELFHAPWEPRALALTLAMGATGSWNIDMSRAARETLPDYGRLAYYEIWFEALVKLLAERELALPDELRSGRALHPARPVTRTLMAADVDAALARGSPTLREAGTQPRFAPGQSVRMYAGEVPHHTRLPRYVRGKRGVIERVLGAHVFADAHALGRGEDPQWLYTVAFRGSELWPRPVDAGEAAALGVSVDAWEPYMEPA
jgi:nitrile hydratase beta subunit